MNYRILTISYKTTSGKHGEITIPVHAFDSMHKENGRFVIYTKSTIKYLFDTNRYIFEEIFKAYKELVTSKDEELFELRIDVGIVDVYAGVIN